MFIKCKACDGDGEGVYGHSWTVCPVCNGACQVFDPTANAPTRIQIRACPPKPRVLAARKDDVDPTGVFPDPTYKDRELASV